MSGEIVTKEMGWLHGWPLFGRDCVLLGTAIHCAACGKFGGIATVAFPAGWEAPGPDPDWPFTPESCPVCWYRENWDPRPPPLDPKRLP